MDKIYIINLDKRIKSPQNNILNLLSIYAPIKQYNCGDGILFPKEWYDYIDINTDGRKQAYNYAQCMINIIQDAKNSNYESILILEDDAKINPRYENTFHEVFDDTLKQLEIFDYDVCYLGGNVQDASFILKLTDNLCAPNHLLDMQACIWNKSSFDKILEMKPSTTHTIDGLIGEKIRNRTLHAICRLPVLITQEANFSYNENKEVDRSQNHIL